MALPEVDNISLNDCTMDSGAWRELLKLPTTFTYLGMMRTPCSHLQVTSFASCIRHGMTLRLEDACIEKEADRDSLIDFVPALNAQREAMHLPPVSLKL